MKTAKMTPSWSLVRPSIQLVSKLPEQVIVLALLPSLITVLGSTLYVHNEAIGYSVRAIGALFLLVNLAASYYLQLQAARGKTPSLGECYRASWRYYWRLLGFTIVFSVMFLIGLILLIVPGLIVLRRYFLTFFYIIDLDLPIKEAMRKSAAETKPYSGNVWGTIGVMLAIGILVAIITSAVFAKMPGVAGVIVAIIGLSYLFLPAFRYLEIRKASH